MVTTIKEVTVPDIGNFAEVEIIEVAVKPGDMVKAEDPLITLETEKASMDVPSPFAGKIKEMKVKLGDKVSQGALIVLIEMQGEAKNVVQESTSAQAAAPAKEGPQKITVTVPDTGSDKAVEIIEVSVKVGDSVKSEDTLITLESEKASMDIPSPHAGKVDEMLVKVGEKVTTGTPILTLVVQDHSSPSVAKMSSSVTKPESMAAARAAPQSVPVASMTPHNFTFVHAGPATRQLARELGVDLNKVAGSGRKNRITTADVKAFVKALLQGSNAGAGIAIEKAPEIDFAQFGEIEVKPLSRIKKWTGKNLYRNWVTIPHITQFDEADITDLELLRQAQKQNAEQKGVKLTPLAFVIKACVQALQAYPQFNASLSANGSDLIFKKYFHIGCAVDTPNGLMVPIIRDADRKTLFEIAKELVDLSNAAREGKLKAEQMQGSCFTISSLGSIGGTAFTPIINAPDVAILGISKAQTKPIYKDEQFIPRKMLPLSLSYDHRVIDGVEGAKFTVAIAQALQEPNKLLDVN